MVSPREEMHAGKGQSRPDLAGEKLGKTLDEGSLKWA